jgi:SulP family sulfate permease
MMNRVTQWLPIVDSLKGYSKESFRGDLSAGVTVAVMLIPQGMAYAMIAGLPPVIGLYAVTIPLFLYALFGSSRQLAVGPVAMVSLLVATGVGAVATKGTANYIELAILLALMVGVIQLAMGLFRMGFVVNFLSHPVISGFTSAAALIIGFSQIKHLLGTNIPRSSHFHVLMMSIFSKLGEIHWLTFAIGAGGIVALIGLKKWKPMFPGALVVVVLGTLITWGFRLDQSGVAIVNSVPAGLPGFKLPVVTWARVQQMLPIALTIAMVGFMESISVAKAFASRNRYQVDANQELVALGVANLGGAIFQS